MPRATGSARRYADAAFGIAERDGNVQSWLKHLERAAALVANEKAQRVLENPALSLKKRRELLEAAIGKDAPQQLQNLLLLLLRRNRLALVPRIGLAFRQLVNRKAGITPALVTSATDMSPAEIRAIEEKLERLTGGKVDLEVRVDPSLLGGVVVRVGDRLLDGSVRSRLERLRDQVAAGAIS